MLLMHFIYKSLFFSFFFIEPKFISQPTFGAPFTTTKDYVNLTGCSVATHFNLTKNEIYWLKNGYEKIHLNISDVIPKGGGVVKLTNNNFRVNVKYPIQGYYQCAIFNASYMKEEARSKKVHLQFQGNVSIS